MILKLILILIRLVALNLCWIIILIWMQPLFKQSFLFLYISNFIYLFFNRIMLSIVGSRSRRINLKTTNWKYLISESISVISQEHKILLWTYTIRLSKIQSPACRKIPGSSKFSMCYIRYFFLFCHNLCLVVFILVSYFFHYSFNFLFNTTYLKLISFFFLWLLSFSWGIEFCFGWPVPCYHL